MRILPLVAVAACASGPTTPAHVFDPCTPTAIVPAEDATGAERASVAAALAAWRAVADIRFVDDAPDAQRVPIRFQSAALVFYGLYEDTRPDIVINRELTDPDERAIAVAHEIGHAFGLVHVTGRSSVMNAGNISVTPDRADAVDLATMWGACR
jgi:hypothetical protein